MEINEVSKFDQLTKDVIIYLALLMDLPEIIKFCRINKNINDVVCDNNVFWLNKTKKDFPWIDVTGIKNYKSLYKQLRSLRYHRWTKK